MDIYTFASGGIINLNKAEITAADGSKHSLGHKENELLKLLLVSSPDVVDKNTMTERVWQRPVISESAISVAIAKLRKLLRLISESDIEIITAKGIGYRVTLAADVQTTSSLTVSPETVNVTPTPRTSSRDDLLTSEEKACLQEVQASSDDFDEEYDDEDRSGFFYKTHCLIGVLLIFSVAFWSYFSWMYDFTQCRRVFIEAQSTNIEEQSTNIEEKSANVEEKSTKAEASDSYQVCWSEISERAAFSLLNTVDTRNVEVVLIDKNKNMKVYTKDGEMINHDQ